MRVQRSSLIRIALLAVCGYILVKIAKDAVGRSVQSIVRDQVKNTLANQSNVAVLDKAAEQVVPMPYADKDVHEAVKQDIPALDGVPDTKKTDFLEAYNQEYKETLAQIKKALIPPPVPLRPVLPWPSDPTSVTGYKYFHGQANINGVTENQYVYESYFKDNPKKDHGIFIEAGALDGFTISQTWFFDKYLNWTGLLIEPDPVEFAKLKKSGRNAWLLNGCLGRQATRIEYLTLKTDTVAGGRSLAYVVGLGGDHSINDKHQRYNNTGYIQVPCYPLNLVLEVIGFQRIDFFSLDIEGAEASFLKSFDFNRSPVDVFLIECSSCSRVEKPFKKRKHSLTQSFLHTLLDLNGYDYTAERDIDRVFVRRAANLTSPTSIDKNQAAPQITTLVDEQIKQRLPKYDV